MSNGRILHTMIRVGDLDRSIEFYTKVLGMKLLRTNVNEQYKYTLAFLGYSDESEGAVIELTYNWGTSEYEMGTAFTILRLGLMIFTRLAMQSVLLVVTLRVIRVR